MKKLGETLLRAGVVYLSSRSDEVGGREMEDKSGMKKETGAGGGGGGCEVKRVPYADVETRLRLGAQK